MSRRGEFFAAARALSWFAIAVYVLGFNFTLAKSVPLIFAMSAYANIESAYSSYSAKRAERRSMENPPAESHE